MSQTTMLSQPRRFSAQTSALPMKPAPPVTSTRASEKSLGFIFLKIKISELQSNLIYPSLFNLLRVVQGQSAELLTQKNLFQTIQSRKPHRGRHAQSSRFPVCKRNIGLRTRNCRSYCGDR